MRKRVATKRKPRRAPELEQLVTEQLWMIEERDDVIKQLEAAIIAAARIHAKDRAKIALLMAQLPVWQ